MKSNRNIDFFGHDNHPAAAAQTRAYTSNFYTALLA